MTPTLTDKDVLACEVMEAACAVVNIEEHDLFKPQTNSAATTIARRAIAAIFRHDLGMSYPEAAEAMCKPKNSHPTVMDWCDKYRCCPCSRWVASEVRQRVGIVARGGAA